MKKRYKKKQQQGFSLLELMIAVAIVGIVSAIAYPSYVEHVKKSKRSDAKVALLKYAQMQESYFVQKLSYAKNLSQLGLSSNAVPSENNEYSISIGSVTPAGCGGTATSACTAFRIDAVPSASQVNDTDCIRFTLTNTGKKGISKGSTGSPTVSNNQADILKCWK